MPDAKWGLAWADRPPELARHFNPAFCGELIGRAVGSYTKSKHSALNLALTFVILPLTLHKPTRDVLPGRANAAFGTWVAENGPLLAELPDRVNRLRPQTREALLFGLHHKILAFDEGGISVGSKPISASATPSHTTDDANEARSAAALLGRWFANQGTQASILQGMGVMP